MNKIIRKLFYLLFPIFVIFVAIVYCVDNSSYNVYNDDLEKKITEFTKPKYDYTLVIAGDSRAERQLVPDIILSKYNIKSINIATSACSVSNMYNALKKYDLLDKQITVVVSVGFFQINDGAIDTGYISMAEIISMSLKDKFILFANDIGGLYRNYLNALQENIVNFFIKAPFRLKENDERLEHHGFKPIDGSINLPLDFSTDSENTKHSWYKNINVYGVRWKNMQSTLNKMSKSNCKFILFQAPVSDAFKKHVNGTNIDRYEKEFSNMLQQEADKYNNIEFYDFYSRSLSNLTNDDYYDPQHLNRFGAEKFTILLMDEIKNKLHNTSK
ncbi:MAG TPA: hypothetical protein VD811_14155 [Desulfuromonadales bacterium]|nr:hypothetical protein [Desulfuromonadales bacterium]